MSPLLQFYWFKSPHESKARPVRVLLPKDYTTSKRHYPVVYALDGQNLFEARTAFGGRHWKIPERMAKMPKRLQAIYVGIDNAGVDRIAEYAPFRHQNKGGGGSKHLHLIIEHVKPFIDAQYRTLPDAENTGIIGSSLGGLLALYAGLQFGSVFGKVGVLSPALWYNPKMFKLAEHHGFSKNKIYMVGSKTESGQMSQIIEHARVSLRKGGYSAEQLHVEVKNRGRHNEAFWSREFPKMHRWLFSK